MTRPAASKRAWPGLPTLGGPPLRRNRLLPEGKAPETGQAG